MSTFEGLLKSGSANLILEEILTNSRCIVWFGVIAIWEIIKNDNTFSKLFMRDLILAVIYSLDDVVEFILSIDIWHECFSRCSLFAKKLVIKFAFDAVSRRPRHITSWLSLFTTYIWAVAKISLLFEFTTYLLHVLTAKLFKLGVGRAQSSFYFSTGRWHCLPEFLSTCNNVLCFSEHFLRLNLDLQNSTVCSPLFVKQFKHIAFVNKHLSIVDQFRSKVFTFDLWCRLSILF